MKKLIFISIPILITTIFMLGFILVGKFETPTQEISDVAKMVSAVDNVLNELFGLEMSHIERSFSPMIIEYKDGSSIVYQQFYCSDPERIKNTEVSALTDVFDSETAKSVQNVLVNSTSAFLYEKENRDYLIWSPQEKTILMIHFDPAKVEIADIIKMAESCE